MRNILIALALSALFFAVGCEKDDSTGPTGPGPYTPSDSTWSDGSGGYYVRLNATSSSSFRYYDLANRQVVSITDAEARTNNIWTFAFMRYSGKTNGGVSGSSDVRAVDLARIGHADSVNFDAVTSVPAIDSSAWESDRTSYALVDWWIYTGPPAHQILPSRKVYVLKTAGGKYAKMTIDSISDYGRSHVGTLAIKFVYQADGSATLSGPARWSNLDCSSGTAYFSFATGGAVAIADPMTSLDWDFQVSGFDIKLNSSLHGRGQAAVFAPDTTFDALLAAPIGPPYAKDGAISVFGSLEVNPWFNYGAQHELISKNHVYILPRRSRRG